MSGIYIESERLILREFTEADLPSLVAIADEKNIGYWLSDWRGSSAWINDWFKGVQWRYSIGDPRERFILLAVVEKASGQLIGQINTGCEEYPEELPGELSVGYFISEKVSNRGYATEAVLSLTRYYFDICGNEFFYATVKPDNAASVRVVTKAGFRFIGEKEVTDGDSGEKIRFNYYRLYRAT